MKYICLGYIEPGKFEGMTEDEREIRPVADLSEITKESERRRRKDISR